MSSIAGRTPRSRLRSTKTVPTKWHSAPMPGQLAISVFGHEGPGGACKQRHDVEA